MTEIEARQLRQEAKRKLEKAAVLESGGFASLMLYVPNTLKERLERAKAKTGRTKREIVIEALEAHLPE